MTFWSRVLSPSPRQIHRTYDMGDYLTAGEEELVALHPGAPHCPDCSATLISAPSGALACNGESCGSVFEHTGGLGYARLTEQAPQRPMRLLPKEEHEEGT